MDTELEIYASWQKSKYDFVKGVVKLTAAEVSWEPLKSSAFDPEVAYKSLAIDDIKDVKRTKKDSPLNKIAFVADGGGLTFECTNKADRDELFEAVDILRTADTVTLTDGTVKIVEKVVFVPMANEDGWGDAPEDVLCNFFLSVNWTLAQSRVIRQVCKRWKKAHDNAVRSLKPIRWHEGVEAPILHMAEIDDEDGDVDNDKDNAKVAKGGKRSAAAAFFRKPPVHNVLFDFETPKAASLLARFGTLHTLDFSGSDCRSHMSDITMRLIGASRIPLATLILKQCVYVTFEGVACLVPFARTLTHLDLTACFRVGDLGVATFVQLTHLSHLLLGETSRITDEGLVSLSQFASEEGGECMLGRTLTLLDLHECRSVTSAGVVPALKALTALTEVNLSDIRGVDHLAVKGLEDVRHLAVAQLAGCPGVTASFAGLGEFATSAEHLTRLNLDWCKEMAAPEMAVLSAAEGLRHLSFKGCGSLDDEAMEWMGTFTDLQSLDLTWCTQVSNKGLGWLLPLAECLRELTLKGMDHVTDEGVTALESLYHLTTLDLSGCGSINGTGLAALAATGVLEDLNLSMSRKLNSEGIVAVASLTSLTRLAITHSTTVTADNMEVLASGLSRLQSLNLSHCPLMQDDLTLELLPLRPTLTHLDLSGSHRLTDRGMVDVVKLSNLRHLVLQGCSRISNQCMAPIARLAKLHTLGIGECKKVTAKGLAYLTTQHTSLRTLDISGVTTDLDEEEMKEMPPWVHLINRVEVTKDEREEK